LRSLESGVEPAECVVDAMRVSTWPH